MIIYLFFLIVQGGYNKLFFITKNEKIKFHYVIKSIVVNEEIIFTYLFEQSSIRKNLQSL